jgi:hypothetical protein
MVSLVSGHGATCKSADEAWAEGLAWGTRFRKEGLIPTRNECDS